MKLPSTPAVSVQPVPGWEAAPLARLGVMAMTLVLGAATLPHLPPVPLLILWIALGLVAGLPLAANAAVARGHALKKMNSANPFHWLLRGGVLRVLLCGMLGICAAGILMVRLSEGGPSAWIGTVAGGSMVLAVMRWGGGISARLNAPVHDAAWLRRVALWTGMATTALTSGLVGGLLGPSDPALDRSVASALVAGLALVGALRAEMWLSARDPAARPVAQLQTGVERIGMNFHPPGTHASITAGREALAASDAAALAEIRTLTEAGFDAMADQVDPFLDGYYSLRAEYWRIGVALAGLFQGDVEAAMEAHLATRLAEALDSENQLRAITDRLAALGLAEARAAQEAREMVLAGTQVSGLNPARLRIASEFPAFAPLPELRTLGLSSTLEARLAGSVAGDVLGAVVARRVVQRLLGCGVLRLGARALLAAVPLLGPAIAFGSDAAALKLALSTTSLRPQLPLATLLEASRLMTSAQRDNCNTNTPARVRRSPRAKPWARRLPRSSPSSRPRLMPAIPCPLSI